MCASSMRVRVVLRVRVHVACMCNLRLRVALQTPVFIKCGSRTFCHEEFVEEVVLRVKIKLVVCFHCQYTVLHVANCKLVTSACSTSRLHRFCLLI